MNNIVLRRGIILIIVGIFITSGTITGGEYLSFENRRYDTSLSEVFYDPNEELIEALDIPKLDCFDSLSTGGNRNWTVERNTSHFGGSCVKSSPDNPNKLENSQESRIAIKINNSVNPCYLTFWWKVSSEENFDDLSYYLDYNLIKIISGETQWIKERIYIPHGEHTILWAYSKNIVSYSGDDFGWVDQISFEIVEMPASYVYNSALDNDELIFTTGGNAEWYVQNDAGAKGYSAVRSGSINHNEYSYISTEVNGPCNLSFRWKVSSEGYCDFLTFYVDGNDITSISGIGEESEWNYFRHDILGDGIYILEWNYSKDYSVNSGQDCGFLDDINIPAEVFRLSINDGIDNNYLKFSTGGNADWYGLYGYGHQNMDCVVSGNIDDNESSYLSTYVDGPFSINFRWKVSSEIHSDILSFYIDGVEIENISGNYSDSDDYVYFDSYQTTIDENGNHSLMWVYSKNENISKGMDCGWVDILKIERDDINKWIDLNLDLQGGNFEPIKYVIWTIDGWKVCDNPDLCFYGDSCIYSNEAGTNTITMETYVVDKVCIEFWLKYDGPELNKMKVFHSYNKEEPKFEGDPKTLEEWKHGGSGVYRYSLYKLNPGYHKLTWCYNQIGSVEEHQGAFFDKFRIYRQWSLHQVYVDDKCENPDIVYPPGDYLNPIIGDINFGIQSTLSGGILYFNPGDYYIFDEVLDISNDISIQSTDQNDHAKIIGPTDDPYSNYISIESDDVNIKNIELYNLYYFDIYRSDNFKITDCYLEDVKYLHLYYCSYAMIQDNTFKRSGIVSQSSINLKISNNTFDGDYDHYHAISLEGYYHRFPQEYSYYSNNNISYNTIENYEGKGILATNIINLTISHNEIKDNGYEGIYLVRSVLTWVFNNNIMNNGQDYYKFRLSKNVYFEDSNVHFFRNYWEPAIHLTIGLNMVNGLYLKIIKTGFPRLIRNNVEWSLT